MIGAFLDRHPRLANRLYGFTPPERGTVVLVHRRVYIVPTRLGWLFGATLLVLLVGSINYALSLGFALTFMLGGMALAGMVHTARNLARIAVSAGRCEPVFVGDPAQFRLHLQGRSAFDRPSLLVRHVGSGSQLVVDIGPAAETQVVLAAPATRRGWMPIGRVMLETRFPLGIFRAWSYVEPELSCLVYPRPERSPLPPPSAEAANGALALQTPGNEDFSGLRGYQLSDSPRHVAWKAVARSDKMLTKQFTGEASAELWLDWQLLPGALGVEQRLSRLAGWVLAAERAGAHYGLRLPGLELPPARGPAHRAACLKALALHGAEGGAP
ncbi:MAG TPA: DUF58 domain-containing protein [Burkholderiales bacterium]|nr:DUF58 domain-containing protein [Burkholderiales bacterium]